METQQAPSTEGRDFARPLRRLRWELRRAQAGLRYGPARLARTPIIFGNSFPKSGTHLLTQVLHALPQIGPGVLRGMGPVLTFERRSGRRRTTQELVQDLRPLRPGDISFGHVIAIPETLPLLCRPEVVHFFLVRDPRDVVVSHAFYVAEKAPDHVHHAHYRQLGSPEAWIQASILGRPELGDAFPDIGARFRLYAGWRDCAWVCQLRFEDFIRQRQQTLAQMLDYLQARGFELQVTPEQALQTLAAAIDPHRSPTFRSGKIGGWKEHFTAEHRRLFKEVAGDLLVTLGYEQDDRW